MQGQKVLVLGDVMLDEFIWGNVERISPEAPVPVVRVTHQSFHVGGAANVASNILSLGGRAVLVGVVGKDASGHRLEEELAKSGVEAHLSTTGPSRPTTTKTRIIAHHQQIVRADREAPDGVSRALESDLLQRVLQALPQCRALILSDYQKGVVTPRLAKAVLASARKSSIPVLVDPKIRNFSLYRRVRLVTPNLREAEQASGIQIQTHRDLEAAASSILRRLSCEAVLVTKGEHGMSLFETGRRGLHIPTATQEVFDVTGAGDTVVATVGLALCGGARLGEAARLANFAAGVVVGKLGTATASPHEILRAIEANSRSEHSPGGPAPP